MKKYTCLIMDDEPLAREVLMSYVEQIDDLEVAKSCQNALEAFNFLQKNKVDIIFVDIKMPKISGLEFLKNFYSSSFPSIIFTTAYREYAVESYEWQALDYLLKPIEFARFLKAINRFFELKSNAPKVMLPPLESSFQEKHPYLFIKSDKKMVKVFMKDILYMESLKDYAKIVSHQEKIIGSNNLLYFENRLPGEDFIRIHKSFLVALDKVKAYGANVVEVEGKQLPLGRTYKNAFLKAMLDR